MFIVFLVCFAALFAWALWRVAGRPQNQSPELGHSLPPEAETGPMALITGTGGPALGTPESLVDDEGLHPSDAALRRWGPAGRPGAIDAGGNPGGPLG